MTFNSNFGITGGFAIPKSHKHEYLHNVLGLLLIKISSVILMVAILNFTHTKVMGLTSFFVMVFKTYLPINLNR